MLCINAGMAWRDLCARIWFAGTNQPHRIYMPATCHTYNRLGQCLHLVCTDLCVYYIGFSILRRRLISSLVAIGRSAFLMRNCRWLMYFYECGAYSGVECCDCDCLHNHQHAVFDSINHRSSSCRTTASIPFATSIWSSFRRYNFADFVYFVCDACRSIEVAWRLWFAIHRPIVCENEILSVSRAFHIGFGLVCVWLVWLEFTKNDRSWSESIHQD